MRKLLLFIGLMSLITTTSLFAAPFEFFAEVTADPGDELPVYLALEITSEVSVRVLVTGLTEVKLEDGTPADIESIDAGDLVAVEAFYTGSEFVALEIQHQSSLSEFELRGTVSETDIDESENTILLNSFLVHVLEGITEIIEERGGFTVSGRVIGAIRLDYSSDGHDFAIQRDEAEAPKCWRRDGQGQPDGRQGNQSRE